MRHFGSPCVCTGAATTEMETSVSWTHMSWTHMIWALETDRFLQSFADDKSFSQGLRHMEIWNGVA